MTTPSAELTGGVVYVGVPTQDPKAAVAVRVHHRAFGLHPVKQLCGFRAVSGSVWSKSRGVDESEVVTRHASLLPVSPRWSRASYGARYGLSLRRPVVEAALDPVLGIGIEGSPAIVRPDRMGKPVGCVLVSGTTIARQIMKSARGSLPRSGDMMCGPDRHDRVARPWWDI